MLRNTHPSIKPSRIGPSGKKASGGPFRVRLQRRGTACITEVLLDGQIVVAFEKPAGDSSDVRIVRVGPGVALLIEDGYSHVVAEAIGALGLDISPLERAAFEERLREAMVEMFRRLRPPAGERV